MIKVVQEFIEHYVDLLDADPQEFFLRAWEENKMDSSDVGYMCAILYEAGIPSDDINEWRDNALLQILDTQISDWAIADGGVSALPVYDFIEVFLDNRIGYDANYVFLFIENHANRWSNYAKVYKVNNITIIARR